MSAVETLIIDLSSILKKKAVKFEWLKLKYVIQTFKYDLVRWDNFCVWRPCTIGFSNSCGVLTVCFKTPLHKILFWIFGWKFYSKLKKHFRFHFKIVWASSKIIIISLVSLVFFLK